MKKYTFTKISNNNSSNIGINSGSNTNYSKILDDLIAADIIDKNPYLTSYGYTSPKNYYFTDTIGKISDDDIAYIDAIKFFKNYGKKTTRHPYIIGKTYELEDGTPIIFFEDSIQIGFDLYYFDDFSKPLFLKNISTSLKKKIAEIYISGLKISIYK